MSETYTVFSANGFQDNGEGQEEFSGVGLADLIRLWIKRWPNNPLVAWAAGHPYDCGMHALREESIAAGRLIDCIDGKYIARGFDQTRQQNEPASCEEEKPAKSFTEQIKELAQLQLSSCDCVNDPYFRGLYNGLELALAVLESREPVYVNKPEQIEQPTPKAPAFAALRLDAPEQFRAPRSI